jgi:hypothetical protein
MASGADSSITLRSTVIIGWMGGDSRAITPWSWTASSARARAGLGTVPDAPFDGGDFGAAAFRAGLFATFAAATFPTGFFATFVAAARGFLAGLAAAPFFAAPFPRMGLFTAAFAPAAFRAAFVAAARAGALLADFFAGFTAPPFGAAFRFVVFFEAMARS